MMFATLSPKRDVGTCRIIIIRLRQEKDGELERDIIFEIIERTDSIENGERFACVFSIAPREEHY